MLFIYNSKTFHGLQPLCNKGTALYMEFTVSSKISWHISQLFKNYKLYQIHCSTSNEYNNNNSTNALDQGISMVTIYQVLCTKWATMLKMYCQTCAPGKDSDQTAHLRSLIWIFTGCILNSQGCKVSSSRQSRLWSDSRCLGWSESLVDAYVRVVSFLSVWLKCMLWLLDRGSYNNSLQMQYV